MKKHQLLFFLLFLFSSTMLISQNFNVYVSDAGGFTNPPWNIYKFDMNGENGEIFIDEELSWPQDIIFLEDQNIVLISNLNTNKITKHDSQSGEYINDFASGISGPTRMKIGEDGLLYVLQWSGNGLVKRYHLDGTFEDDFTNMGVSLRFGLDWDSEGNLYVSSYGGNFIRKFDINGNDLGLFISSGLQGPTNIWFDDDGGLLVCNWNGSTIKRFDSNGVFEEDFITGLMNPEGVAYIPNGNILIGNGGTSSIKMFDPEGNYIEDFIESGAAGLIFPNAVVIREITSVSVTPIEQEENFVQPTIGRSFFFNTYFTQNIEQITIYTLKGKVIETSQLKDHLIWDATNYPEGLYIILAHLKNGEQITQKVMVKN